MKFFMGLVSMLCMVGLACHCQASTVNEDGLISASIAGHNTYETATNKETTAPAVIPIDAMYVGIFRPFAGSCANGACNATDSRLSGPVAGTVRNSGRVVVGAARWVARPFANARVRRAGRRC